MEPRFRIRTRDGLEWAPDDLSELCEIVSSGHVQPEDLMYDALTGTWAPAGGHPAYRLATDPLVNEPRAHEGGGPTGQAEEGAIDLLPVDPEDVGESESDFVRRMEREREEAGPTVPRLVSFRDPATPEAERGDVPCTPVDAPEELEPPARRRWHRRVDRWIEEPVFARSPTTRGKAARRAVDPVRSELSRTHAGGRTRRRSWWSRYRSLAAFGVVAGATTMIVLATIEGTAADDDGATPLPTTSRLVEGNVRAEAYGAFLRNLTDLRDAMDLVRLPAAWLEGTYLAQPSAYPDVRAYWSEVLRFAGEAQARERDFYRAAYATTIDRYGVRGPSRSLRLVAAMDAFGERSGERASHYDRVRRLAMAALTLHDELLALEGRVRYEPAAGRRISMDPVIEAVGEDPEAKTRLDASLDQLLRALLEHPDAAAGSREAVPRWLVGGLVAR